MDRSACAWTLVVAVELLLLAFGSKVCEVIVAVSVIVLPSGVAGSTCTVMTIWAVSPLAMEGDFVQFTVPLVPTVGVVQLQLAGLLTDWKVVCAGSGSLTVTLAAALGPALLAFRV